MANTTALSASVAFSAEELYSILSDSDLVDVAHGPDFHLAALPLDAEPRIAVVRNQLGVVALVSGSERKICGFRTGHIEADCTFAPAPRVEAYASSAVLAAAAEAFGRLPGIRSVRFLVHEPDGAPLDSLNDAAQRGGFEMKVSDQVRHCRLPLPNSYTTFLEAIDKEDAEFYAACRVNSEALGYRFVSHVPLSAFRHAAWQMVDGGVAGAAPETVRQALAMAEAAERPLLVGLRTEKGEWLAIAAGWMENDRAVVATTLYAEGSTAAHLDVVLLDVILRGYLVQHLTNEGVSTVMLRNGWGEILNNDAEPMRAFSIRLRRRSKLELIWNKAKAAYLSRVAGITSRCPELDATSSH